MTRSVLTKDVARKTRSVQTTRDVVRRTRTVQLNKYVALLIKTCAGHNLRFAALFSRNRDAENVLLKIRSGGREAQLIFY